MPCLTLKNIPDELLEALKRTAADHRRSLNREVIFLLERSLAVPPPSPQELLAKVDRLRRSLGKITPVRTR